MRAAYVSLLIALMFLLAACNDGTIYQDEQDKDLDQHTERIVGGASYSGLPAVGALAVNGQQHCTGTLIASNKVVTAAHCVVGVSASQMQFVIGPSLSSPEEVISVASLKAHPAYDAQALRNDIGLVILAQAASIEPLGVVRQMDSTWVGRNLFFVGYGVDNGYQQSGAGIKRAVWMAISSVSSTTFRYDHSDKNTCNGDSGGPAFHQDGSGNYLVAGVTSYGDYYCTSYGVDTRVDAFIDFLEIDDGPGQVDLCQGETFEGRCDSDTVVWCENDNVYRQDCAADAKVCGYNDEQNYYACVEEVVPQDPCKGETWMGRCENDQVIWCENEQVLTQDCAEQGKLCQFDDDKNYFGCIEPTEVDPCNGETFEGRCDADTVIYCENEQVNSINCAANGASCSWSSSKGYYDCI
ncbi:MAG: trypsin-like serine protease [Deltaproteobacteria bacterium]|nr:trypsin-like serine protease [Deltaproteobacteria bacterium]